MTPDRWQQIEQLFHAALEREPTQRAAFLRDACAADDGLRHEVESLLDTNTDPPVDLYTDSHTVTLRASETADGARIVYELPFPKYREVWLKDLRRQEQQMLVRVDDTGQVNAVMAAASKRGIGN